MDSTFDITGTRPLSQQEMTSTVGGDGWLATIATCWVTGATAIKDAVVSLF